MSFENALKLKRDLFLNGYKSLWIYAPSGSELQFWFEIIDHLQESEIRPILKRLEENHDFNNQNSHKPGIAQLKRAVAQVKAELGSKNAFNMGCRICNKGWIMISVVNKEPVKNWTYGSIAMSVPCRCEQGEKNREIHKIPETDLQEKAFIFEEERLRNRKAVTPEEKEKLLNQMDEYVSKCVNRTHESNIVSKRYNPEIEERESVACL